MLIIEKQCPFCYSPLIVSGLRVCDILEVVKEDCSFIFLPLMLHTLSVGTAAHSVLHGLEGAEDV